MFQQKSQKILGPLKGQQYRQANLINMGITKIDQRSESVYVDSEASIKKLKNKQLDISRSLYKSQTYKDIYQKGSIKDFESPINESLNQPLQIKKYQEEKLKSTRTQFKYSFIVYAYIFISKVQYYIKLKKQQERLVHQFQHLIQDKASDFTIKKYQVHSFLRRFNLFQEDSYERFVFDLIFFMLLAIYSILIPFILTEKLPAGLIFIFIFFYSGYKVVNHNSFSFTDFTLLIGNGLTFYDQRIILINILIIVKLEYFQNHMILFTYNQGIRLLNSLLYIFIYSNIIVNFWISEIDSSYLSQFTNQINIIFCFDQSYNFDQDFYLLVDSVNRIISMILLVNFIEKLVRYMSQNKETQQQVRLFQNLMRKKCEKAPTLRLEHQIRSVLFSKAQHYIRHKNEEILSSIDQDLPMELQKTLNFSTFLQVLQKSSYITSNFSKEFQRVLSEQMKEETIEEGEVIQNQNQNITNLIFLLDGAIQIQLKNQVIGIIESNHVFNQFEYFSCINSPTTLVTHKKCRVALLDFQKFYESVCLFQKDYQVYRMWYDRISCAPFQRANYRRCYICKSQNHITAKCASVFFQPNYQKIISNSTYTIENNREKKRRLEKKHFNALISQNLISITAVNFAQQQDLMTRNNSMVDQYLGQVGTDDQQYQLFAEDESRYQRSQTFTHQQSMTAGGRDRVPTIDSNVNRTLTIRTLKASEHETNRLKPSLNDSIVVSSSPQQQKGANNLMMFPREAKNDIKKLSGISSGLTIDRNQDKKSSIQSQQLPHSTSILASREVVQQLQSNLGSPNIQKSTNSKIREQSINVWIRSDTQPIVIDQYVQQHSDMIFGSVGQLIIIKEFENMQYYEWYFPRYNFINIIERFEEYLSSRFTKR